MNITKHDMPVLKMPEFLVDTQLSTHLDEIALLKNMNKSFCCGLLGKAGSGKTSLLIGLLQTKHYLKKVFDTIYVFMPASSRASMKNNVFNVLPEDQLFESVRIEDLTTVFERIKISTGENKKSLIVFDDVQTYLKNPEIEKLLLHIVNNRRHLRTCVFIVAQTYTRISKAVRSACTDFFMFKIAKSDYEQFYDEHLDISKKQWKMLMDEYNSLIKTNPNSFIYAHVKTGKFFLNWDEVNFLEDNV